MKEKLSGTMPKLVKFLNRMFDQKRSGAAIFERDHDTVIVTDLYSISNEHLKTIEVNFPQVSVAVVSSDSSRSGLLLILSLGGVEKDDAWRRSVLRLCFHIALFHVILYLSIVRNWESQQKST
jgi:hypothetical protein